jgi:hypothetical protein
LLTLDSAIFSTASRRSRIHSRFPGRTIGEAFPAVVCGLNTASHPLQTLLEAGS